MDQHGGIMSQRDNAAMGNVDEPTALLGGLTPMQFMRRHWQKKPLLVRQAMPDVTPPLDRASLFALATRDDVESRLVARDGVRWTVRPGPLPRRALPPLSQPNWTVLVQGLDLHVQAAHELLARFRFAPDARLDDLMLSYASDGGGVGPHLDSYDVFLLQVAGRRRWRIGRCDRPVLRADVPLKMLTRFDVEHDWLLEPGDMLYLPPDWAHEGTAVGGDCMTASIGFRAPTASELAQALFARLAEVEPVGAKRYRDPRQRATREPASLPVPLLTYAHREIRRAIRKPGAIERALGEWLTEPKPQVWFEAQPGAAWPRTGVLVLDRRSRMAYDERQIFINGESYRAAGRDARVVRALADARRIEVQAASRLSETAQALMLEWLKAGWMHVMGDADEH
jgi:50S ribosomal protein L16 3-hydroxylase